MVLIKPGEPVREGDPILECHFRNQSDLDAATALAASAIEIDDDPPPAAALIVDEVRDPVKTL
jgi:thymidine phosphorylase